MNILTDKLPESVELFGSSIPIHADHRSCIRAIIALLDDGALDDDESVYAALHAFYAQDDFVQDNLWMRFPEEALAAEAEFLRGVPVPALPGQKSGGGATGERAYSFLYDQTAIYAAFWQQYRIDLARDTLHWWRFKALLDHLHGNHMAEIMCKRTAQEEPGMTSEQKKQLRKEKTLWKLPALAQETRQADAVAQALMSGNVQELEAALGRG